MNNSNATVVEVRQKFEGNDISVKANNIGVHVRAVALGYFHWRLEGRVVELDLK